MPEKICPACKATTHVRTAICVCGYVFYIAKKQEPEVGSEEKKVVVTKVVTPEPPAQPPKPVRDYSAELRKEAADLGYNIKELAKTGLLRERFLIKKTIHDVRYLGNFNEHGKITGIIMNFK